MPELVIGLVAGIAVFGGILALGRMAAASPRATLAAVIAVTVGLIALIAQWSALFWANVCVMLVLGILTAALRRRTLTMEKDKSGYWSKAYVGLINLIRRAFNQPRIWLIPNAHIESDERAMQT